MTPEQDLPTGQSAATRRFRGTTFLLLATSLCWSATAAPTPPATSAEKPSATSTEAPLALNAPATPAVAVKASADVKASDDAVTSSTTSPAKVGDKPASDKPKTGLKAMASGAAASTLTMLLPHVAAGEDSLPLLGRSTMVANDLGRLLSGASNESATPSTNEKVQTLLQRALTLLGTPYRWGGTSPDSGFDCSGLVGYVFRSALGIELPRVSRDMARKEDALLIKDRSELVEGDLVFFSRGKGRVDHVGIYVGDGQFVHAPRTGKDVEVASLVKGYWAGKFLQARRVLM